MFNICETDEALYQLQCQSQTLRYVTLRYVTLRVPVYRFMVTSF